MTNLLPEKPILVFPKLAASIGLEEATMLSLFDDITRYKEGMTSQGLQWYHLSEKILKNHMPFWDSRDIQRISQRLRDLSLILIRSAPFMESLVIDFAFNRKAAQVQVPIPSQVTERSPRAYHGGASIIAANWQPDRETLIALNQLNIPGHFAREQTPEFVNYWRETGETQRAWGSKFIQHVKRQWTFHSTQMARQNRATTLPSNWQPSSDVQSQIAGEGIPAAFSDKVLSKFRLYHQKSGTIHINWDMPFFSWVKEEWQQQDTPFIEAKKSTPMNAEWQPDPHTLRFLTEKNIDIDFIKSSIPEFIHKWIEKKAIYSEWGNIFATHISEQWQFVVEGINRNPISRPLNKGWRPSPDCLEMLVHKSEIDPNFIEAQLPEFILYWTNRAEPRHSWDNIFLQHIKRQWAAIYQGNSAGTTGNYNERQQSNHRPRSTRDISLEERLTDRSWAN